MLTMPRQVRIQDRLNGRKTPISYYLAAGLVLVMCEKEGHSSARILISQRWESDSSGFDITEKSLSKLEINICSSTRTTKL